MGGSIAESLEGEGEAVLRVKSVGAGEILLQVGETVAISVIAGTDVRQRQPGFAEGADELALPGIGESVAIGIHPESQIHPRRFSRLRDQGGRTGHLDREIGDVANLDPDPEGHGRHEGGRLVKVCGGTGIDGNQQPVVHSWLRARANGAARENCSVGLQQHGGTRGSDGISEFVTDESVDLLMRGRRKSQGAPAEGDAGGQRDAVQGTGQMSGGIHVCGRLGINCPSRSRSRSST